MSDFASGAQPEVAMRKGISRLLKEAKDQNLDGKTASIFLGSAVEYVVTQVGEIDDNKVELHTTLNNKAYSLGGSSIGRGILEGMAEVLGGDTVERGGHKAMAPLLTSWAAKLKAGTWDVEALKENEGESFAPGASWGSLVIGNANAFSLSGG